MQGFFGGIVTGGLVSVLALSVASVVSEQPAGSTPPSPPLVEAPVVDGAPQPAGAAGGITAPVASAPDGGVPDGAPETSTTAGAASPAEIGTEATAPLADTDPLDVPQVMSVEGAMTAPASPGGVGVIGQAVEPVLPNPQSLAPQVPATESDLTVSTAPASPVVVAEPDAEAPETEAPETETETAAQPPIVVDVPSEDSTGPVSADDPILAEEPQPRIQLQGQGNSLLGDRDTGVTVRRPEGEAPAQAAEAPQAAAVNALVDFAATYPDPQGKPLMSVMLIDDGSMSAAAAALSGLPFPVTIVLDATRAGAAEAMAGYRAAGFEVALMADLPEGAQPADVEVTFGSVFSALPEAVAVLDMGTGGLQADRDVTAQAMAFLADQGRGFVTVSQGLNMAGRAAAQSGVPATTVYRELDGDNQDARVIRRFIDQAAFRARQESGVVLVGRVRPDTISALILWGTANSDAQVVLVPVSAVLTAQ